ncbi:alpha/beta hydrolase family protein [Leifsonia sp. McL0607]|uniref:alpha/beta hydrolase family protein n=1 Tax=Leifsonia sp. McL0607 TaxID=3415672 RepID=UPI003CE990C2
MPGRPKSIPVRRGVTPDLVRLPRTAATEQTGDHGIWLRTGEHRRVGPLVSTTDDHIERRIVSGGPLTIEETTARWTGHAFSGPDDLGLTHRTELLVTGGLTRPAWVVQPPNDVSSTWAIHVHGARSSRVSALRSVPVACSLGMRSIIPSYYGDTENQEDGPTAATLGGREALDVDTAISYAITNGAKRIVLFGWSMGGAISLLLTERSAHRDRIAGLILVSPVVDFRSMIVENAAGAGLPRSIGRLIPWALSTRPLSGLIGEPEPIDFGALDWTTYDRLKVPALVLHSTGDRDVPFASTRDFASANRLVTLEEFAPVPHQLEWNSDPAHFDATAQAWLKHIA